MESAAVTAADSAPGRRLVVDGRPHEATDDALRALLADPGAGVLWLDLDARSAHVAQILGDVLGVHPLAVEDAEHFGQRAKAEEYGEHLYLVMFGAGAHDDDADRLAEVHLFVSERLLVTVHREPCPALDETRRRAVVTGVATDVARLLHRVLDDLVDSFFPVLDEIDAGIEAIEDALDTGRADDALHRSIFRLRRRLVALRKVVAPARDQMGRLVSGSLPVPGLSDDSWRYFRDVEDHLIRITEAIDGHRDLLAALTDVHLTAVSNRLNAVMKQLSVVAGVFLPLTFLTGFFGQNFGWLVDAVGGASAFWVLGVGLQVISVVALLVWFRRRGWI